MKAYIFLLSLGLFASTHFIKAQGSSYSIFPGTVDMAWDYTEDLDMKAYISSSSMLNQDLNIQLQLLIFLNSGKISSLLNFAMFNHAMIFVGLNWAIKKK